MGTFPNYLFFLFLALVLEEKIRRCLSRYG
jgi:hypothetical protein